MNDRPRQEMLDMLVGIDAGNEAYIKEARDMLRKLADTLSPKGIGLVIYDLYKTANEAREKRKFMDMMN